jgi:hypothetical protein
MVIGNLMHFIFINLLSDELAFSTLLDGSGAEKIPDDENLF